MRNLSIKVNQKTKIEAQYFKLIGVTLLMTAACVSDSGARKSLFFDDIDVREIILEQFQLLSTSHWQEVIDWENAIDESRELPANYQALPVKVAYSVVKSSQSLPDLNDEADTASADHLSLGLRNIADTYSRYEHTLGIIDRNKYSLITRAGPLA